MLYICIQNQESTRIELWHQGFQKMYTHKTHYTWTKYIHKNVHTNFVLGNELFKGR